MHSQGKLLHPSEQQRSRGVVEQISILQSEGPSLEFVLTLTRCATLGKLFTPLSTVPPALKWR